MRLASDWETSACGTYVLASVLPGLFTFNFPERVSVLKTSDDKMRYDVELFDRAMALLPLP